MMSLVGWGRGQQVAGLCIATVLAACTATASSVPLPTASPTSTANALPTGSNPLRESLTPGSPRTILFRLDRSETASYVPHLTLYGDGRLLRWDRLLDSLTIQTLGPMGIDQFLAVVRASGSFEVSHTVPLEVLPGVEPPGIDPPADRFTLASAGGEPVVVITSPYHDPLVFKDSTERDTLMRLADSVMDPSWLPAEAWIDPAPRPYVPDAYLLFSGVYSMPGMCPSGSDSTTCQRDVSTIKLPFALPADGIGPTFTPADGTESVIDHCAVISPEVADQLTAVLWPEFATAAGHSNLSVSIPWRQQSASYDLTIRPLFPEEAAACAGKSLPPVIGP
jgi:hypothetical protein